MGECLKVTWMQLEVPAPLSLPPEKEPQECCKRNSPYQNGQGIKPAICCDAHSSPGTGNGSGTSGGTGHALSSCGSKRCSGHPVRYGTGEIVVGQSDLVTNGHGISWGHTRRFSSRLSNPVSLGNGYNWQIEEWSYLLFRKNGGITIMGNPDAELWFDLVNGKYTPRFSVKDSFHYNTDEENYQWTTLNGQVTRYHQDGYFMSRTDSYGNKVEVTSRHANDFHPLEVQQTSIINSQSVTDSFLYSYDSNTADDPYLLSIIHRRKTGTGSWKNISKVSYTYYNPGDLYGNIGDLRTVTNADWDGSVWNSTGTIHYRYWVEANETSSSSSSSSSSAYQQDNSKHRLKYIVDAAAYQKMIDDPTISHPLTATDLQVSLYASHYFEYDDEGKVTKEIVNGGSQSYTFSYQLSTFQDGYNRWKRKTIETQPDGTKNIVYTNYASQTMLKVFQAGTEEWYEYYQYDPSGNLQLKADPSAITGYDEDYADLLGLNPITGLYTYLHNTEGLIHTYTHHGPTGFLASESVQKGEQGTSIKLSEYKYIPCYQISETSSSSSSSSSSAASQIYWFLHQEIEYPPRPTRRKK